MTLQPAHTRPAKRTRCDVLQRWGALWGRGQRRLSSASSDDGEDVSTNAQGTAEVAVEDPQSLQHAAGPAATTRCMRLHTLRKDKQHSQAAKVFTYDHGRRQQ